MHMGLQNLPCCNLYHHVSAPSLPVVQCLFPSSCLIVPIAIHKSVQLSKLASSQMKLKQKHSNAQTYDIIPDCSSCWNPLRVQAQTHCTGSFLCLWRLLTIVPVTSWFKLYQIKTDNVQAMYTPAATYQQLRNKQASKNQKKDIGPVLYQLVQAGVPFPLS